MYRLQSAKCTLYKGHLAIIHNLYKGLYSTTLKIFIEEQNVTNSFIIYRPIVEQKICIEQKTNPNFSSNL